MTPASPPGRWLRYAQWVERRRWGIVAFSVMLAATSAYLTLQLPLRSDFSHLLPPDKESVQHLRALQQRARAFGTVFVVIRSEDPDLRTRVSRELYDTCQTIDTALAAHCTYDDTVARDYFWRNRFLFVDLDELIEARDALADRIKEEKLRANPLWIELDDEESPPEDLDQRVESLRERLDEAESKAKQPEGFVSEDKLNQVVIIQSTFPSSDISRGRVLVAEIERLVSALEEKYGSAVSIGVTGNVVQTLEEQASIVRGVLLSAVITVVLCAVALFLYYRSVLPVFASLWSLAVGVLATLGFAKLAIGYLNLVTAFLAAIVVGNGINAGLILLARYFEELRRGAGGTDALARALAGAARGTLAASLTASVAYGSLIVTDFRGFRHFGVIGGAGMVLCWVAAFTILPAGLCILQRRRGIRPGSQPAVGRVLAWMLPRRQGVTLVACSLLALAAAAETWRYARSDYVEDDWRNLRSSSRGKEVSELWLHRIPKKLRQGIPGRFVIALDDREAVPPLIAKLRKINKELPKERRLLAQIRSLDDLLPEHQEQKIEVLAEIRELLEDDAVKSFSDDDKELIDRIRPPPDIQMLKDGDVPDALAWPFIEKDGERGRLILATSDPRFRTYNVHDRVEFAEGVRALDLPENAVVGGQAFIIADIVESMKRDGPLSTVVALLGSVLVVWLVVGLRRHGLVTLLSAALGILGMLALVSLWGLKVNFIDFVALPITIGLGIDYSVNLAVRERQDPAQGPHGILTTTGGAVLLCSFTTMVGYGSLLLSENAGIRSFGLAAILGELACVAAALFLTPTLLARLRARQLTGATRSESP